MTTTHPELVTDQAASRFLNITHHTDVDQWRARIEAKSARNRHFLDLEEAAKQAAHRPVTRAIKPRKRTTDAERRAPQPVKPYLRPCADCGQPTRPRSAAWRQSHPNIAPRGTGDYCATCSKRRDRAKPAGQPPAGYTPDLRNCTACGNLTRPDSPTAAQARPDLPKRRTKGLCNDCYNTARRETNRSHSRPKIRECPGCHRPTRPNTARLNEYPGTVARWSAGYCKTCHQARTEDAA